MSMPLRGSSVSTSNYYAVLANSDKQSSKAQPKFNKTANSRKLAEKALFNSSKEATNTIKIVEGSSGTSYPPCDVGYSYKLHTLRDVNGVLQPFDKTVDTDDCIIIAPIGPVNKTELEQRKSYLNSMNVTQLFADCLQDNLRPNSLPSLPDFTTLLESIVNKSYVFGLSVSHAGLQSAGGIVECVKDNITNGYLPTPSNPLSTDCEPNNAVLSSVGAERFFIGAGIFGTIVLGGGLLGYFCYKYAKDIKNYCCYCCEYELIKTSYKKDLEDRAAQPVQPPQPE